MNPIIQKALEHLEYNRYAAYFEVMDEITPQSKKHLLNLYRKTFLEKTEPPVGFHDKLRLFTKEVQKCLDHPEACVGDETSLAKHLIFPKPFQAKVFVGRDRELKDLQQILFDKSTENVLCLVNGQGGIGKTSLASRYYHSYSKDYHHLAWLSAEPSILDSLLRLCKPLNVEIKANEEPKEQLEKLLRELHKLAKPSLLVLDNANNAEDLEENYDYLAEFPNLHILLTTRLNVAEDLLSYTVQSLDPTSALALFVQHYPTYNTSEEALFKIIYEITGGNTLVLEVLAKNLQENNLDDEFYSLETMLQDLQKKGLFGLSEQEEITVHWRKIKNVIPEKIIEAIYDLGNLNEKGALLLTQFSILPAESISFQTLKALFQQEKPKELSQNFKSLYRRGWLDRSDIAGTAHYKISPVIQEIIRAKKQQSLAQDCEALLGNITTLLDDEDENGRAKELDALEEIIQVYYPLAKSILGNHVKAIGNINEEAYDLLQDIRYFERHIRQVSSDPNLSYEVLQRFIQSQKKQGTPAAELLDAYHSFVHVCYNAFKYEEAIQFQDKIIQSYKQDKTDLKVLADALDFAGKMCLFDGQHLAQGLAYYREEGEILRTLQSDETTISGWQNSMALVLRNLGGEANLLEAESLLRKTLNTGKKNYSQNISNIAITQSNLALVLIDLRGEAHLREARDLLESALQIDISVLGANHPNVATSQSNLAMVLRDLGEEENLVEARGLLENALQIHMSVFGANHPNVALNQSNLALVLKDLGGEENLREARDLLESALQIDMSVFGANHPTVALRQSNLAMVLRDLGGEAHLLEARGLLASALQIHMSVFGANHPTVAIRQSNLAMVLRDLGGEAHLLEAKKRCQNAFASMQSHFPQGHPHIEIFLNNLWALFIQMTQGRKATFSAEEYEKYREEFEDWLASP